MADEVLADHAVAFDHMLVDAALGPLRNFTPDSSLAKTAFNLARKPSSTARRLRSYGFEGVRIAMGTSDLEATKRDRRFNDPAWTQNPLLRRVLQTYLSTSRTAFELIEDADLDWRDNERMRFLAENFSDALAPSNFPLINPESAKALIDTGGLNFARGARAFAKDMLTAPRIPEMVDKESFVVGENLACTPGKVVYRTDVFELIQYTPQTEEVYQSPLLIVPPTINKYYALDLAPGRSMIEAGVGEGRQALVMSWRNPDARHAKWNLDTYVKAIVDALDATETICETEQTTLAGICSGGILATMTAAYLAAEGEQHRINGLATAVTVIDNTKAGTASAFTSDRVAAAAKRASAQIGYLDGRNLAEMFAWLRPSDLVWSYVINNYLLGKKPPSFDVLFWNSDTTRMTAGLHADFVDLAVHNQLAEPGAIEVMGVPIDLTRIEVDAYIVAGIADHITPWENCYRTNALLGGHTRFILSKGGHLAALVNPPTGRSHYFTSKDTSVDAQTWLKTAEQHEDTWWFDFSDWLNERSGGKKPAPDHLGGPGYEPRENAPGTYVHDS